MAIRIGVFGTFEADREPRATIVPALEHSALALGVSVDCEWIDNDRVSVGSVSTLDGVFIAPGSALEDSKQIVQVIRAARENGIPCLGTCGGFQRMVTEYAVNVLGYREVRHEECDPDAVDALFTRLSCPLSPAACRVILAKESKAHAIYHKDTVCERHYCRFGLNPKYAQELSRSGLRISGTDENGSARIVELPGHPFFMGMLFVPQVSSMHGGPHPIVSAFLSVAAARV